jgi:hypothetical protein
MLKGKSLEQITCAILHALYQRYTHSSLNFKFLQFMHFSQIIFNKFTNLMKEKFVKPKHQFNEPPTEFYTNGLSCCVHLSSLIG